MNRRKIFFTLLLVFFLTILFPIESLAYRLPENPNQDFVYDEVGVISPSTKAYIEEQNRGLRETGAQYAVAIVSTLDGESIEEVGNQLFRKWGIGDSKKNNGVLLLVAINDHKMRIEVGYGLEGAITDGACGSIIRNTMAPPFKEGDYDQGIRKGSESIFRRIYTEYGLSFQGEDPEEAQNKIQKEEKEEFSYGLAGIVFALIILGVIMKIKRENSYGGGRLFYYMDDDDSDIFSGFGGGSSGGFGGGFGGGSSGGGGASGGW